MTDHESLGTVDVTTDEGTVAMMDEIQCEGKYTVVEGHANYCPLCGEEL